MQRPVFPEGDEGLRIFRIPDGHHPHEIGHARMKLGYLCEP